MLSMVHLMLKDFANAVDKMSRAGYKGKHGEFTVPEEDLIDMFGLFMQATVGDNVEGIIIILCSLLFVSGTIEHWK